MKKYILKSLAIVLALILAIPVLPANNGSVASAAVATKPAFSITSKTVVGTGSIFTINILNAGSKIKNIIWYSKNENVASVAATSAKTTGKVTTVGKGTTYIKSKITYQTGKSVFLSCKVTVQIKATNIAINNANDSENGRQLIAVGNTFDFNSVLTPNNANDNVYWSIEEKGKAFASVDSNGVVTGVAPGVATLRAVASFTQPGAATSLIYDSVNIEVVSKAVKVVSATLTSSNKLTITFDNPIKAGTVIGANNQLLSSIVIASKIDANGTSAKSLGTLTGELSTDYKTLTVTSTNAFNGTYGLLLASSITSTDGIALTPYNENLTLNDTAKPYYVNYTVDDTGLKVSLNFSEAMDYTNLQVTDARVLNTTIPADATTISILNTKANYVASTDKKSLIINLSTIVSTDRNKMFSVYLSGLKDLSGNTPTTVPIVATFQTDTTIKPQATIVSLLRTGYNTLTATFSRGIKTPGFIMLSNGEYIQGVVDTTDTTKVNYNMSNTAALLTGTQNVTVTNWDAYNTAGMTGSSVYGVNFAIDATGPTLTTSTLSTVTSNNINTYVLTLTYNKNVVPVSTSGVLPAKLIATNGDIYSGINLNYTATISNNVVQLLLVNDQISKVGTYTITLPSAFVRDTYANISPETTIQISQTGTSATKLPAPVGVVQAPENPSIIYVYFNKKIDMTTAQNITNYTLIGTGTTVIKAEVSDNTETGATVKLTLRDGCLISSTLYPITISGIKGYQDSYATMDTYTTTMSLKENKVPAVASIKFTYPTTITITFDESVTGTPGFTVLQGATDLYSSSNISGNIVTITLKSGVVPNTMLSVTPTTSSTLGDASGNKVLTSTLYVTSSLY